MGGFFIAQIEQKPYGNPKIKKIGYLNISLRFILVSYQRVSVTLFQEVRCPHKRTEG